MPLVYKAQIKSPTNGAAEELSGSSQAELEAKVKGQIQFLASQVSDLALPGIIVFLSVLVTTAMTLPFTPVAAPIIATVFCLYIKYADFTYNPIASFWFSLRCKAAWESEYLRITCYDSRLPYKKPIT